MQKRIMKQKNIVFLLKKVGFKKIYVSTNMFLSPFFTFFGWKIPDLIQKFEDKYLNHLFRLFLFVVCKN